MPRDALRDKLLDRLASEDRPRKLLDSFQNEFGVTITPGTKWYKEVKLADLFNAGLTPGHANRQRNIKMSLALSRVAFETGDAELFQICLDQMGAFPRCPHHPRLLSREMASLVGDKAPYELVKQYIEHAARHDELPPAPQVKYSIHNFWVRLVKRPAKIVIQLYEELYPRLFPKPELLLRPAVLLGKRQLAQFLVHEMDEAIKDTLEWCISDGKMKLRLDTRLVEPDKDWFSLLQVETEPAGKGRTAAILVRSDGKHRVPLVRTTAVLQRPSQPFGEQHAALADRIASLGHKQFNNALLEVYDSSCKSMGEHSDMALDLDPKSTICLFSCYRDPNETNLRELHLRSKNRKDSSFEDSSFEEEKTVIRLEHGMAVFLPVALNARVVHKIVAGRKTESEWLGLTLRRSKRLLTRHEGKLVFQNGTALTLADDEQRREFCKHKGQENRVVDYEFPEIAYTISPGDIKLQI